MNGFLEKTVFELNFERQVGLENFFKKPKCHYMYSLHTPMPKEGSLERRTFIHPVSCTASLSYSSECNNFRENSMLSQGFPEGS